MQDTIEIHERVSALEQDQKSTHRRLDNLEKLVDSVHIIATETKEMRGDVNNITKRVDEIESRPRKRWDTVITSIITTLVGGVIGYVIGLILQ